MAIIVLGTVALDTVQTPQGKRENMLGGSAVHFSMIARLFTKVNLAGVVGEDFPKKHINFLKDKGINLSSLSVACGKTFHWEGEYQGDLNTALTLNTELGVLVNFKPQLTLKQRYIKHVFLANLDPDIQNHLLDELRSPELVGLDSMNYWIKNKRKELLGLLKRVDIFVANDAEARELSGEMNLIKAAENLRSQGAKMVMIKKGEHGVIFSAKDFLFCLPAYPVAGVIDPTGAGDSFAGAFMGYLSKVKKVNSSSIRQALARAVVCASFNVEGFGVERTASLTIKEVEARLKVFKKYISFK